MINVEAHAALFGYSRDSIHNVLLYYTRRLVYVLIIAVLLASAVQLGRLFVLKQGRYSLCNTGRINNDR